MVAADARTAVTFSLSPGQNHDAAHGRELMARIKHTPCRASYLVMDKAYEDAATRQLALQLNFEPVVPPRRHRVNPWKYDRQMYKRRNEVERLFRRLKSYRRVFARFDKLDVVYAFFVTFALIADHLIYVNRP